MIISIGRQTGSGGREISELLAKELNFSYLDKDTLLKKAKILGYFDEIYNFYNEKPVNCLIQAISQNEVVDKKINQIAKIYDLILCNGNYVILGRCTNYFFRQRKDFLSVFLYAGEDFRLNRLQNELQNPKNAHYYLHKYDDERALFHKYYTGEIWGEKSGYDICINTEKIGINNTLAIIKSLIK